jgi:glycosyltransferase involved in cell wall biosynthesis
VKTKRLAVLISFSGEGGVERMVLNLLDEFATYSHLQVDLLTIRADSAHLGALPDAIRVIDLGTMHTGTSLLPVMRYMSQYEPAAILAAKDRAGRIAMLANRLTGNRCRVVIRLGTTLSAAMVGKSSIVRRSRYAVMRSLYGWADRIVAVSDGVAQDTLAITGLAPDRVCVIRNPVVNARLRTLAQAPVAHPWLIGKHVPVILGVGRLTEQKGFDVLLAAFAQLRAHRPCRLVILGEGKLRDSLTRRMDALGIHADVDLPGFRPNPYPEMAAADVFVLSSRWEGSPNVLTEALALGTPVVATDCPSGPREILQDGMVAPLVPMNDPASMAAAIEEMLDRPGPAQRLIDAVAEYQAPQSARRYLDALELAP